MPAQDTPSSAAYVVIGGGTAGSTVTRRLIDQGHSVVVLEAGGPDDRPEISDPLGSFGLFGSETDWAYSTVPQSGAGGRAFYQPRGKALGGSSILNGMLYVRGVPADYDAWAAAGAHGWSWKSVEPYFRLIEDYDGPDPRNVRGHRGPVRVQHHPGPSALTRAYVDAAVADGARYNEDYNAGDSRGASFAQSMVNEGKRVTAWRAYAGPVLDSSLLTVVTGARVGRIRVEGGRAVAVEYSVDGQDRVILAEREIVLSAGVFGTPQVLLLSGIGPRTELVRHGIDVVIDLPGVGKNLRDHAASPVIFRSRRPVPLPVTTGVEAHLINDGNPDAMVQPDRQGVLVNSVFTSLTGGLPEADRGFMMLAILLHPYSSGTVTLGSADPYDAPVIDPGLLTDPRDVDAIVDHLEQLRRIAAREPLADWIDAEVYPGEQVSARAQLRDYVRASVDGGHHQVGTARMGDDDLAVVDEHLRVRGVEGLRVADASVMPFPTAGNTVAPVLMIGERAADFMLKTAPREGA
jgi:choline dehydrogenase